MAQDSIPWTTNGTGDGQAYASSEWTNIWRSLFYGRSDSDSGPIPNSGDGTNETLYVEETAPVSAAVYVRPGRAMVHGTFYENDATETLAIAPNASGNPRIDIIVLRKDWTAQTVRMAVLAGTPAGVPTPPALTQTSGVTWEIPLAHVAVANGFVTISDANITDARHFILGPGEVVGEVKDYAGSAAPEGYVLAYGQAVSRTVRYDRLFGKLSTTYGVGDGSTTYNLPDLRGRVGAGKDNMGGAAANRITAAAKPGVDGTALGAVGGVEEYAILTAEMPAHGHTAPSATSAGVGNFFAKAATGAGTTGPTDDTGGDEAHTNLQPSIILNKIIHL